MQHAEMLADNPELPFADLPIRQRREVSAQRATKMTHHRFGAIERT
jgi:hypothetical protein